ncbi:MAG: hypothetical protein Q8J64_08530 [Thermodesulfovibrionales bacterium]|nr:hypothetical protein [Thermodesulfovibrionales bacterium]
MKPVAILLALCMSAGLFVCIMPVASDGQYICTLDVCSNHHIAGTPDLPAVPDVVHEPHMPVYFTRFIMPDSALNYNHCLSQEDKPPRA